jgi:hypothetical protein
MRMKGNVKKENEIKGAKWQKDPFSPILESQHSLAPSPPLIL